MRHVLFSPNGTRVVTALEDATLRHWNAQTGELIGVRRGHGDGFDASPVFTPDGSRLVPGSADGTVRIWDMGLAERNGILSGHKSYVYDVAFSLNGAQVASAAWDATARLWDATTERQTGLLKHETEIINSVAYRRDGRQLATMERARGVTLWDLSSQKAARDWQVPPWSNTDLERKVRGFVSCPLRVRLLGRLLIQPCALRSDDTNGTSLSEKRYGAWLYADFRSGLMRCLF
ncbi:MAG: WD40 repeat domain-containing protein [Isosphaerales bacterium]